jgi:hypothetical protein
MAALEERPEILDEDDDIEAMFLGNILEYIQAQYFYNIYQIIIIIMCL